MRLLGVAHRDLAGQEVAIRFAATRKVVATAVVGHDGRFSTSAPLPPKRLRSSNRARYQAELGSERSLSLKLMRRLRVTALTSSAAKVTIAGRVERPLAAKAAERRIVLERVVACRGLETVATFAPRRDGRFSVTVPAPDGEAAAVYRLRTKVRRDRRSKRTMNTFSLPRAVDIG